ncbi:MAG: S-layer homology domain-containing protein [Clostridia bacterium]|nr:S-layer homology domain-containing protein [Clostridia bacterium]
MKKVLSMFLLGALIITLYVPVSAVTLKDEITKQFLFSYPDEVQTNVKNIISNSTIDEYPLWQYMMKKFPSARTQYGDKTKVAYEYIYFTYVVDFCENRTEKHNYYTLYDAIHYAQNGEFDLLIGEKGYWEVPIYMGGQMTSTGDLVWGPVTTAWIDDEKLNVVNPVSYYDSYNTFSFVEEISKLEVFEGLNNIEKACFVRHGKILYLYIKADGVDYAIPYVCGRDDLRYPGYASTITFKLDNGSLYRVEDMYTIMLEQLRENHVKIMSLNPLYVESNIKLAYDKYFEAPKENIAATSGEMAEKMKQVGLIKGNGEDLMLFDNLTRAEGITMLLRMIGEEENASQAQTMNIFSDVDESHWAFDNISYAYSEGLTKGTSETTFSPEEKLSAPQFMVMLLRAMGYDSYEGETLTLENASEIAKKVGFNTDFYDVQDLKRGHMAAIASRALNVVTANGKTVAENLLDEGVITANQFETISTSDFYTVPYEEKESWKIEGYPAFPDVTQKHYAIYKEATRDNRTEVAFFDIENEQEGDCLVYDGSSLTLSDNARYINSVKYVLSGNTWIKFEEGYPAISNYASEVLASDLDIK